ncbi:hypothetical protein XENOCAPTIV_003253, partial [Xenoophorus captivus]
MQFFQKARIGLLPAAKYWSVFISADRVSAFKTEICTILSVLSFLYFPSYKEFKLPFPLPVKKAAAASCLSPGIKVEVYAGSDRMLLSYEQAVDASLPFLHFFYSNMKPDDHKDSF